MRKTQRLLGLQVLLSFVIMLSATSAKADVVIWGSISGLGQWQATNYVSSVYVEDDHGVWYPGYSGYSSYKGGLYWAANVPTWANRSYQVWVFSNLSSKQLWYNPASGYGAWWWAGGPAQRGPTVAFMTKGM